MTDSEKLFKGKARCAETVRDTLAGLHVAENEVAIAESWAAYGYARGYCEASQPPTTDTWVSCAFCFWNHACDIKDAAANIIANDISNKGRFFACSLWRDNHMKDFEKK